MKNKEKPLLSILITSYNREIFVDKILYILYSYQQRGLSFFVVVSDDSIGGRIKIVADTWNKRFDFFKYVATEKKTGMDNNFRTAYESCETEYCWLLGDHRYIEFKELQFILRTIENKKFDCLILNCNKTLTIESKIYNDINTLMNEQGWHITNNASCIIPAKFIDKNLYSRYLDTCFLHMGLCIENLCLLEKINVIYLSNIKVKDLNISGFDGKSSWLSKSFSTFGKKWYQFVMSLPNQLSLDVKEKVLKDHDRYNHIFSLKIIFLNLMKTDKNYIKMYKKDFFENKKYLGYVSDHHLWIYEFLMRFYCIITPIYKITRRIKHAYK